MFSPHCHVSLRKIEGLNTLGLNMDSQSRVFEAPVEENLAGVPLRCHRSMRAQSLVPWTPTRILATLFQAAVAMPAQLAPARITRRRA
jgi:hypothetical protein